MYPNRAFQDPNEDPGFRDWFYSEAIYFMLSHRLDMLNALYQAYELGFRTVAVGDDLFHGTPEELDMFEYFQNPAPNKRIKLPKNFEKDFLAYMNKKLRRKK